MNPFWWNETSMGHNPQYYQPLSQPSMQPPNVAPTIHPSMGNVLCSHTDPQYPKYEPFYQSHHCQPVNQCQSHCQSVVQQQQPQYCQHIAQQSQYCQHTAQQPQYCQHFAGKTSMPQQQKRCEYNGNQMASVNVIPYNTSRNHQHPIPKQRYPRQLIRDGVLNVVPKNAEYAVNEQQKVPQKPKNRRQYNAKAEMKRLRNRRKLAVFAKPCGMWNVNQTFFQ